ncbi:hypothetical protein WICPIJ_006543 [Wickerhamomyces pijperi]|uniref:C2H2-type domain-containing protein n=1 Tax=Wickerhamomyces pijperi TaxID=599730 RepID=A0A9P8Q1H9_WICPI|nr:hypothetical protein WICPIJ_006543 [Wickerhamomyces pijperi]
MSKEDITTVQHNINNYLQGIDVSNEVLEPGLLGGYFTTDSSILIPEPQIPLRNTTKSSKKRSTNESESSTTASPQSSQRSTPVNPYAHIPNVPSLPSHLDPKKTCPFCHKIFTHHGSLGRHLDKKKGTAEHPLDVITEMRAFVARKGDVEAIRLRKKSRSFRYNSKQDVKVRNKEQRRVREKKLRFKKMAIAEFLNSLGQPVLPPHPSFPRLVLYFLSPDLWPHDPPSLETHRLLTSYLTKNFSGSDLGRFQDIIIKLKAATDNWLTLSDTVKLQIWTRELRKAAEEALSGISLAELSDRDHWIDKRSDTLMHEADSKEEEEAEEEEEEEEEDGDEDLDKSDEEDPETEDVSAADDGHPHNSDAQKQKSTAPNYKFEGVDLAAVAGMAVESSQVS